MALPPPACEPHCPACPKPPIIAQAREKVAEVETQRLQAVLQHPQFQANPLAAVASHLAATLPAVPPPPTKGPAKDAATLRREKKKRRKERARQEAAMGDD